MRRYRLLDLIIDLDRQTVERDGIRLDVAGLSFRLLACLVEHGDRVVTFDELIDAVWAPAVVNEETITQRVRLLRQALGDDARAPRYVRTVRSRGYQLGAPVVPDLIEHGKRRFTLWPALAAVGVLAAAAFGASFLAREQKPAPSAEQQILDRAHWYARMGQRDNNERALALYDRALHEAPDDVEALSGASRTRAARTCLYNGSIDDARDALRIAGRAVSVGSESAVAWSALGYARDCLGDIGGAIAAYEAAVRLDPADDATRSSAAYLYQEQGRLADALHANLSMQGDPARVRYRDVQLAREYELLGFTTQAGQRYKQVFDLAPDNVFGNIGWPAYLFARGRFDEARAAIAAARQRDTARPELPLLEGELALRRGDKDAASNAFAEAHALRPEASLPETLSLLYAARPIAGEALQQRVVATRKALANDPWPASRFELVWLLQAAGDHRGAIAALDDAVAMGWRDAGYLRASPLFAPIAADPGFQDVIGSIERRTRAERERVLEAKWCPADLPCDRESRASALLQDTVP
ncbi:winged helix-turn-helix transcriptional regulator [Luteibacter aegosomatissinici]|uniref:winged helix-turn-helix transcriptional regulator n=1 Tax=Luteibacter aegosomatissinici TaxID=2911539 RepID=UPI001FFACAE8|nr:winged helix-turn-helix transcriptional regulator [Luteibacter aegosomatissinici]UPG94660.1 winged helix-turn-helix domain-containing protein [Luteibacter aegosomatissinici]